MAQQTIDIGSAPNDGTGDPIRDAFDKCNDNFTELYGSLAGLLDFQGATDCSANPNYPAASQGDIYIVSVAGKIGGASGKVVEVGDFYLALADNAGGTEASVGTSWAVLQANITGGIGSGVDVEDEGVAEATAATTLNFTGAGVTAADMGGGVVDISIPGAGGVIGVDDEGSTVIAAADVLNFVGAGVTVTDLGGGEAEVNIPGAGAAWALAGTGQTATGIYDFAVDGAKADIDFTGLGAFSELLVICKGLTTANSGLRIVRVSVDNGSTYNSASGDYVNVDSAGVESNTTNFSMHSTNATAARTCLCHIKNTKGPAKVAQILTNTATQSLFVASASDINAIRVFCSAGGNITGGTVRVYAR